MCLAVPAKLVTATADGGIADVDGSRVRVSTLLVPDAVEGDWVLIHAGFAIQRLRDDEAADLRDTVNQIRHADRARQGGAP